MIPEYTVLYTASSALYYIASVFLNNKCYSKTKKKKKTTGKFLSSDLEPNSFYICACSVASVLSNSLRPHGLLLDRLLCPWDYPTRILEWVAMPSFRGSSQPRDRTLISRGSFTGRQILYH